MSSFWLPFFANLSAPYLSPQSVRWDKSHTYIIHIGFQNFKKADSDTAECETRTGPLAWSSAVTKASNNTGLVPELSLKVSLLSWECSQTQILVVHNNNETLIFSAWHVRLEGLGCNLAYRAAHSLKALGCQYEARYYQAHTGWVSSWIHPVNHVISG